MIKVIFFDFNGIFVKSREKEILLNICERTGFGKVLATTNYLMLIGRFQLGELSPHEFWMRVFPRLNENEYLEFVESEYEKPFEKNLVIYSIFEELSGKFPIYCLSNSNFLQGKAYRKQRLYPNFSALALSHEISSMKPFPQAFGAALSATKLQGLKARECLFIDDSIANVLAAKLFGFQTILYKNESTLRAELEKIGVL